MPSTDSPILADAADVLSDQLRDHLARLSIVIKPHASYLDQRFRQRLRTKKYDQKQLKALSAITPGAARWKKPMRNSSEAMDHITQRSRGAAAAARLGVCMTH